MINVQSSICGFMLVLFTLKSQLCKFYFRFKMVLSLILFRYSYVGILAFVDDLPVQLHAAYHWNTVLLIIIRYKKKYQFFFLCLGVGAKLPHGKSSVSSVKLLLLFYIGLSCIIPVCSYPAFHLA